MGLGLTYTRGGDGCHVRERFANLRPKLKAQAHVNYESVWMALLSSPAEYYTRDFKVGMMYGPSGTILPSLPSMLTSLVISPCQMYIQLLLSSSFTWLLSNGIITGDQCSIEVFITVFDQIIDNDSM